MGRESPRQPSSRESPRPPPNSASSFSTLTLPRPNSSTLDRDSVISLDNDSIRVRTLDGDLLEPDSWNPQPPLQLSNPSMRPTNRPLKRSGEARKSSWDENHYLEDGGRMKTSGSGGGAQRSHDSLGGGQRSHDSQRSHDTNGGHRRASDEDIHIQSGRRAARNSPMQTLGGGGGGNSGNKPLRRSGEARRGSGESRDRPSTAGGGAWVELSEVSGGQPQISAREEAWNKQQTRGGHRTLDSMPRRRSLEDNSRRLMDSQQLDQNRITIRASPEDRSNSMDATATNITTTEADSSSENCSGKTSSIVSITTTAAGVDSGAAAQVASSTTSDPAEKPRNVKALLEKLSDFLSETNLEQQIEEERKEIHTNIEHKNEEILQKRENHRHKLNEIHEGYKREIQRENERHVEDLKVTERDIAKLRSQLQELEQLNISISRKIPCNKSSSFPSRDVDNSRVRELLECPVCLEGMRPPKKIFQCSNGHVICELCKNNPGVRTCPTCRVEFSRHNCVRNIVAEKLARSTYSSSDSEENLIRPSHTRESNMSEYSDSTPDEFPTDFPSGLFLNDEEDDTLEDYYRARSLLYNRGNRNNDTRRTRNRFFPSPFLP